MGIYHLVKEKQNTTRIGMRIGTLHRCRNQKDAVGKQPITTHMMMCLISVQAVHTHTHNCAQTPSHIHIYRSNQAAGALEREIGMRREENASASEREINGAQNERGNRVWRREYKKGCRRGAESFGARSLHACRPPAVCCTSIGVYIYQPTSWSCSQSRSKRDRERPVLLKQSRTAQTEWNTSPKAPHHTRLLAHSLSHTHSLPYYVPIYVQIVLWWMNFNAPNQRIALTT